MIKLKYAKGESCEATRSRESWELSTCLEKPSIIASGESTGKSLIEYLEGSKENLLGTKYTQTNKKYFRIEIRDGSKDLPEIEENLLNQSIIINIEQEDYWIKDYLGNESNLKAELRKISSEYREIIEEQGDRESISNEIVCLLQNECFYIEAIHIEEEAELTVDETSFHSLIVTEGMGYILSSREQMTLSKGDSIFLPAGYGTYCIDGKLKVIISKFK